jgi:hypothetical protein
LASRDGFGGAQGLCQPTPSTDETLCPIRITPSRKDAKKKVMNHLTTKVFPSVSHLVRYLRFRLLWVRNEEGDKSPYYEGFRTLCTQRRKEEGSSLAALRLSVRKILTL